MIPSTEEDEDEDVAEISPPSLTVVDLWLNFRRLFDHNHCFCHVLFSWMSLQRDPFRVFFYIQNIFNTSHIIFS